MGCCRLVAALSLSEDANNCARMTRFIRDADYGWDKPGRFWLGDFEGRNPQLVISEQQAFTMRAELAA